VKRESSERKRDRYFKMIGKRKKGLSVWEIAELLNVPFSWVAPRVTELKSGGLIVPTGERRLNPTSGKMCGVFKISGQTCD